MDEPSPFPTVPEALWARMRRLDPWCWIAMSRNVPYHFDYRHCRRTWHVSIRDDLAKAFDSVSTERPTLAEALELAVAEAERKGWPLPHPARAVQSLPAAPPWPIDRP